MGETADTRFLEGAWIDWDAVPRDSYVRDIPAIAGGASAFPFPAPVTFLVGENGSGKSTLLEALAAACGFNQAGGTRNFAVYRDESDGGLGDALHTMRTWRRPQVGYFFRAETFFDMAKVAVREYESPVDYLAMSHGESFLAFMQAQARPGLFLMDEPEAALSPQRQLTLLLHMHRMARAGSQFIVATHSPILLGLPGAAILEFGDGGVQPVEYEDTEPYQITRMFLEDRERVLHHLLQDFEGE